jgi:hypothetical protein
LKRISQGVIVLLTGLVASALVAAGCDGTGTSGDEIATTSTASATTTTTTSTTLATAPETTTTEANPDQGFEIAEDKGLVYLTDDEGDWTLNVFYPAEGGPWPLIVVIPPQGGATYAARAMAQRGAVAVVADSWTIVGWEDPAACIRK